jgi:Bifunctional DNA primase/polymerase, N-terminal
MEKETALTMPVATDAKGQTQHEAKALLAEALRYTARGWPVVPLHAPTEDGCSCEDRDCTSVGKPPRTWHDHKDATTDKEMIALWVELCAHRGQCGHPHGPGIRAGSARRGPPPRGRRDVMPA